jgi:hypothetical protein
MEWYEVTFRLFERFHKNHNLFCPSPCTCPPEYIQTFLWWLLHKDRPITAHAKFGALRAFFRWLVKEGFHQDNPVAKVTLPKVNEPLCRENCLVSRPNVTVTSARMITRTTKWDNYRALPSRKTAISPVANRQSLSVTLPICRFADKPHCLSTD